MIKNKELRIMIEFVIDAEDVENIDLSDGFEYLRRVGSVEIKDMAISEKGDPQNA